jgi:C_GCAxxG_C_C family probable redox protein
MMTKTDYGADVFLNGFNCAQAVFSSFCEDYGLDAMTARKIASGLGSGARVAEMCGAVSGAVLVIGLKYGQKTAADVDMKLKCNAETEEFMRRYRVANGHIVCRNLLGCDIMTETGLECAIEKKLFTTKCKDLVVSAIEILIDMGY